MFQRQAWGLPCLLFEAFLATNLRKCNFFTFSTNSYPNRVVYFYLKAVSIVHLQLDHKKKKKKNEWAFSGFWEQPCCGISLLSPAKWKRSQCCSLTEEPGHLENNEILLVRRHSLITSHSSVVDTQPGTKNKHNSSTAEQMGRGWKIEDIRQWLRDTCTTAIVSKNC